MHDGPLAVGGQRGELLGLAPSSLHRGWRRERPLGCDRIVQRGLGFTVVEIEREHAAATDAARVATVVSRQFRTVSV